MIDALGFKGAWGSDPKKPSTDVLDTLKAVQAAVLTQAEYWTQAIRPTLTDPSSPRQSPLGISTLRAAPSCGTCIGPTLRVMNAVGPT